MLALDLTVTQPGNEVGLFYNAPGAHTGLCRKLVLY